jgi:UDP:flavonoid glycosyltransferase YjiC (YdhE family)
MRQPPASRVFFFLSAGWGPVVRTLPIINRLADCGISSSLAVGGAINQRICMAGFDVIRLDLPTLDAPKELTREWWSPYHSLALPNLNIELLLTQVEVYRKAISDGRPAVVITDINPIAALAARSLHVPHITISQSLFLPCRKLNSSRWTMPPALPAINKVLACYGIDPVESPEHLDVGEITFVPSFHEFDPMEDVPASLHYLGPILGNELIPLAPSAHRAPSPDARPNIFFYPGRPHDAAGASGQELLNVGLGALSTVDATVTIATAGYDEFTIPEFSGLELEIVPWRVISAAYRPSLIVHHGGHGACLTAIKAGIPSVVLPTHAEREYNGRNLAALGCGAFVPMEQIDVPHIRRTIESAMETPAFACASTKWSKIIADRKYGGADLAARIISQTIDAHSPTSCRHATRMRRIQ